MHSQKEGGTAIKDSPTIHSNTLREQYLVVGTFTEVGWHKIDVQGSPTLRIKHVLECYSPRVSRATMPIISTRTNVINKTPRNALVLER
jgi:hypothetical protein